MSDMDLSATAKALLRAARADTPGGAARARIWNGVSSGLSGVAASSAGTGAGDGGGTGAENSGPGEAATGPGLAASASGGAIGGGASGGAAIAALKGAGFLGGSKLLAVGALFGSAVTVGLAATLIGVGSTPRLGPDPQEAPAAALVASPSYGAGSAGWAGGAPVSPAARGAGSSGSPARGRDGTNGAAPGASRDGAPSSAVVAADRGASAAANARAHGHAASTTTSSSGGAAPDGRARAVPRVVPEDVLMRESALVAEARGAFMRHDFEKALAALHVTHGLVHRELEPEELSLEARALRAVGRDAEADAAEATLKSRFPDHALSR